MAELLNVRNFHSLKKDKDYSIIQILRPITDSELEHGMVGEVVSEEVFLPDKLVNKFGANQIGKELDLHYSIVNGKAVLEDITIK